MRGSLVVLGAMGFCSYTAATLIGELQCDDSIQEKQYQCYHKIDHDNIFASIFSCNQHVAALNAILARSDCETYHGYELAPQISQFCQVAVQSNLAWLPVVVDFDECKTTADILTMMVGNSTRWLHDYDGIGSATGTNFGCIDMGYYPVIKSAKKFNPILVMYGAGAAMQHATAEALNRMIALQSADEFFDCQRSPPTSTVTTTSSRTSTTQVRNSEPDETTRAPTSIGTTPIINASSIDSASRGDNGWTIISEYSNALIGGGVLLAALGVAVIFRFKRKRLKPLKSQGTPA
jgi:hypothetical protein